MFSIYSVVDFRPLFQKLKKLEVPNERRPGVKWRLVRRESFLTIQPCWRASYSQSGHARLGRCQTYFQHIPEYYSSALRPSLVPRDRNFLGEQVSNSPVSLDVLANFGEINSSPRNTECIFKETWEELEDGNNVMNKHQ